MPKLAGPINLRLYPRPDTRRLGLGVLAPQSRVPCRLVDSGQRRHSGDPARDQISCPVRCCSLEGRYVRPLILSKIPVAPPSMPMSFGSLARPPLSFLFWLGPGKLATPRSSRALPGCAAAFRLLKLLTTSSMFFSQIPRAVYSSRSAAGASSIGSVYSLTSLCRPSCSSVGFFSYADCPISSRLVISGVRFTRPIRAPVGGAWCFRRLTAPSPEHRNARSPKSFLNRSASKPTGVILEAISGIRCVGPCVVGVGSWKAVISIS